MCNTKCCKDDRHEEDLLCCMPVKHCCGGYSEHNNCCPHDRCCNQCCDGCCDKCCCCALKKKIYEIEDAMEQTGEDISNIENKLIRDEEKIEENYNELSENIDTLEEQHRDDIEDVNAKINKEISDRVDDVNDEEDRAKAAEEALGDKIDHNVISNVEYNATDVKIYFKNSEGEILSIVDASDFVKDGMLDGVELVDDPSDPGDKALHFTFNTDSGKQDVYINVGDLFETNDYLTKTETLLITNTLDSKISSEISRAKSKETELNNKITSEESRAKGVENNLDSKITAEQNARIDADNTINNRIDSLQNKVNATEDYTETPEFGKRKSIAKVNDTIITAAIPALPEAIKNPHTLNWSGFQTGSYDGSSEVSFVIPNNNNQLTNGKGYQNASEVQTAINSSIAALDSSTQAAANKALSGITITDGKISAKQEIAVPTNNNLLINGADYQNSSDVSTAINTAINGLDSRITEETNKAIASVVITDGKISAHTKTSIPRKTSDITNDSGFITDLSAAGNILHYHDGSNDWVDITVPFATKALKDNNGDVIDTTYLKKADAAPVAISGSYNDLTNKPAINNGTLTIQKNGTTVQTFTANQSTNATANISVPTKVSELVNDEGFINSQALSDWAQTNTTAVDYINNKPTIVDGINLTLNPNTYEITASLKSGNTIVSTSTAIDLPLETMVVDGTYNNVTKKVVLTLKNGLQIEFSVADLIDGLVNSSELSEVAFSGDYSDLSNTPTIPVIPDHKTIKTDNATSLATNSGESITGNGTINLHKVSKTGAYNDLIGKPNLADVATSGDYRDLSNKPTIPTVNNATLTIQRNGVSVKTFTANQATDVLANIEVPTKTSDLTNDSGFLTSQVQSDWNQTNQSADSFIKNKPNLATVATTGDYNDLINKPDIPSLSGYATETYVTNTINGLDSSVSADSGYALKGITIENGKITSKTQVALPEGGTSTVTINGNTYTIQQAVDYILGLILWQVDSQDNTKIVAKNGKAASAAGFYDTTVS